MPEPEYFHLTGDGEASESQLTALSACRRALLVAVARHALVLDTTAELDADKRLALVVSHPEQAETSVRIEIDGDGRVDMWSDALHPDFSLCFNDRWEPDDCVGDLDCAVEALQSMVEGRLRSELTLVGGRVAERRDVLVREDGEERVLDTQWYLPALATRFRRTTHVVRQLSFAGRPAN